MSRFDIKSADGSVTRYSGKLKYHGTYLSPSYVEFTQICSDTPIAFAIGDYVDYDRTGKNVRYRLYSLAMPKRNAGNGSHGESFTYSNVQLFNESKILEFAPCRDLAYVDSQPYFSSKSDFAVFITVADLGVRIQENLNRYEGADRWRVRVQSGLEGYNETEARNVSISGSCLNALSAIYDTWAGLGWVFDYEEDPIDEELHPTIIIGGTNKRTSANTTNRYEYGSGLVSLKKSISNAEEFSTRLRVFGSTRNMPTNWYSRRTDIYNAGGTFIPNLMLPFTHDGEDVWGKTDNKYDANKAYFEDAAAIAKYGLIEKSVYFDGSSNSEIYPSIEGVTIAELKTAKTAAGKTEAGKPDFFPQSSTGTTRIDTIAAVTDPITDNGDIGQGDSPYIEDITQGVTFDEDMTAKDGHFFTFDFTLSSHTYTHGGSVVISITPMLLTFIQHTHGLVDSIEYAVSYNDKTSDWKFAKGGEAVSADAQKIVFSEPIAVGSYDDVVTGEVSILIRIKIYNTQASATTIVNLSSLDDTTATFRMRPALKDRFQIRIPQIGFDMATAVGTPSLSMKSGMCAGREFFVTGTQYESDTDTWLITLNRTEDSSLNKKFPNTGSNIAIGDTFVILGVSMPEEYIEIASDRLYAAGKELFDKNKTPIPTYEPQLDSKYILEQIEDNPDDDTYVLREGKYMNLLDDHLTANTDEYVIIDTLTISEDDSNIPTYAVTLRDLKSISFARGVETAIRGINVSISNLANAGAGVTEAERRRWNYTSENYATKTDIQSKAGNDQIASDITATMTTGTATFTVTGLTLNASAISHTRYAVKFASKVTEVDSNGLCYLSLGGLSKPVYFEGGTASVTNTWQAGDVLDVWYQSGQWHVAKMEYPHLSYEVWGTINKIVKPNN